MTVNLYFVGTAGSGKSTLTKSFKLWMEQQGYQAVTVNLDPGAEDVPYPVDIDIRDWVSLDEVMKEQQLGPNGAQIACADMIAMNAMEIKELMDEFETHYFLIDTPGQMELFTFRESSRELVKTLGERSVINFLFDPILSKQPTGFVSLLLLAATTQFRFDIPYFPILSKVDMLKQEEIEQIQKWATDHWELNMALREHSSRESHVGMELVKSIQNMGLKHNLSPVSSTQEVGMENIYAAVQDTFYGGEDLEAD